MAVQRVSRLVVAVTAFVVLIVGALFSRPAAAVPETVFQSVVSVLPVWPDKPQAGGGTPLGAAPEGSGIAIAKGGKIVTAYHVIEPAERVDVRLHDGRIVPASVLGIDKPTDIALLEIEPDLPVLPVADSPALASPACVISNAYGLDLSVTCGVISARHVSNAGFNPVEDFLQTDAAANPGSSGGALVDSQGHLLGMMSAIFASKSGMNIGVNFAVSSELLIRVAGELSDGGAVKFVSAGWGLDVPPRSDLAKRAGVLVIGLEERGPAQNAGLRIGDLLVNVRGRAVTFPRDVLSALASVSPGDQAEVVFVRDGQEQTAVLQFADQTAKREPQTDRQAANDDCPHLAAVCKTRQAVFPVSAFDPIGSSVRIGEELLVTNRHITADQTQVTVYTPTGELTGEVLPSAYEGDLALIRVKGLPKDGLILKVRDPDSLSGPFHSVGADISQRKVRVFPQGELISAPADSAPLGRLHVTAHMQPGVSGGALVNAEGDLIGIATSGGQGRFEAIPLDDVAELILLRGSPYAYSTFEKLGATLRKCKVELEAVKERKAALTNGQADELAELCLSSENYGLFQEAGDTLGRQNHLPEAIALHQAALKQVPNSLNSRLSLLTAFQQAEEYKKMVAPAHVLLKLRPNSPLVLRRVLQAGVLAKDRSLAEAALVRLEALGGPEAKQARRYFDRAESLFDGSQ
ncbi:putative protease signal peptide protein [Roseibium sp. TrichSKD4]|uniref:trypsin-like peptidase domain-containing protein n=1 Tax=Roseibium sp. TrichSKD4 TaxID=744980 RepID=UPI0001E570B9|nr:trypsin-like peptidase domain-containing protein [Roseibium sp. TrichSKD4]EFO30476.1 putative protease signal peptide protein [Roseibium sp. TrichSKD4]